MKKQRTWAKRLPPGWHGPIAVLGLCDSRGTGVAIDMPHPSRKGWMHGGILFELADYHRIADSGRGLLAPVELPCVPELEWDAVTGKWRSP